MSTLDKRLSKLGHEIEKIKNKIEKKDITPMPRIKEYISVFKSLKKILKYLSLVGSINFSS